MKFVRWFTVSIAILLSFVSQTSALSHDVRISLITQDLGDEMYAYFGHTAIRVKDDSLDVDQVYNYGTFDFGTPNFYIRFIKGDLDYCLSIDDYDYFEYFSNESKRTIHEQILNLSYKEKVKMVLLLETCYNTSARYYRYDFLKNNCSTKIRDIIEDATDNRIDFGTADFHGKTFRQLLEPLVSRNYWIEFGINFLMGRETDKLAKPEDYMFLPIYIHDFLDNPKYANKSEVILDASPEKKSGFDFSYLAPWLIVLLLSALSLWKKSQKIVLYFVCVVFSLFGLLILSLGIYSLHPALGNNMNILWTIPALLILIVRNAKIGKFIRYAYLAVFALIFINWFWFPQEMSTTFIPWMLCMSFLLIVDLKLFDKVKCCKKNRLAISH